MRGQTRRMWRRRVGASGRGPLLAAGGVWLAVAAAGCRLCPPRNEPLVTWEPAAQEAVVRALAQAQAAAGALADYTCHFHRHERVGGRLGTRQEMEVCFRRTPFSLYMRWVDPAKAGSEFLYVAGRYDDQAFARLGGALGWLVPTMRLPLDDPRIVRSSRHAVTDFGMATAARFALVPVREALEAGRLKARRLGAGEVHGEPAEGFEVLLPEESEDEAHRLRVWFDPRAGRLSRVEAFNSADELLEDYAFTQVKANVGLSDADFDPHNPAYDFYRRP